VFHACAHCCTRAAATRFRLAIAFPRSGLRAETGRAGRYGRGGDGGGRRRWNDALKHKQEEAGVADGGRSGLGVEGCLRPTGLKKMNRVIENSALRPAAVLYNYPFLNRRTVNCECVT
jgi:hypothetical protein